MTGFRMFALTLDSDDLEQAALFRLESAAKEHGLNWHGDDPRVKVRGVRIEFMKPDEWYRR